MIEESQAREIAQAFLGSDEFSLNEFSSGWRVVPRTQNQGSTPLVVEREKGEVRQFPSSIPPMRIETRYVYVRHLGHAIVTEA